jgi:mycofactocin glycosyltransferase
VPVRRAPGTPSGLRPPPPAATTPLPGSFTLREDGGTRSFADGTVLLGGSPLRLLRITERARDLVERWSTGTPVGDGRAAGLLARRLVEAGAFVPRPTVAALGSDDVTVVVPVRDRPAQLDRLLASDSLHGLRCVVVDDASSDPAATERIATCHGAHFVALDTNAGPAGARNAGVAHVTTALVAFVDSDCVPTAGWLRPLLGHFEDPLVAAVAPRVVPALRHADSAYDRYVAVRSSLDRGTRAAPVRPGSPVSFVPSAALVVRADVVEGHDLFDPALRGGEDVDLVWRLAEAGWSVRYVPESTVVHDGAATLGDFLARRAFYGSTAAPLAQRHPGALAPAQLSGWSLSVWAFSAARRPLSALAVLAASIGILARRLDGLVRSPLPVAARIAAGGTARSALPALGGLARAWAPALVTGLAFRRTRRAAALALLLPAFGDWAAQRNARRSLDPLRYAALHVADDVAYGLGVWDGCARAGTAEPLVPHLSWRARVWSSRALRDELAGRAVADTAEGGHHTTESQG